MRKPSTKSTIEEITEYLKLYKEGKSLSEIGRKFNRDHSTISRWIKRGKIPVRSSAKCLNCSNKITDLRFALTNFCGKKCWDEFYLKAFEKQKNRWNQYTTLIYHINL